MTSSSPSPALGLPVPRELQRSTHHEREEWIASGVFAVDLLCGTVGRADLAEIDVLDVGCGTKIVKTLLDNSLPVRRYVGVDVYAPVIDWLQEHVHDSRFAFHHLPARNDLYNPEGAPLGEFDRLPAALEAFDLICLFSVFTHLAPDDYVAMLRLLRRHIRSDGRLIFSVFLNDPEHPSHYALAIEAALASDDTDVVEHAEEAFTKALSAKVEGFVDEMPDQPLRQARYDKDYALELIEGTGWKVESLSPPREHIQHSIVCRPV